MFSLDARLLSKVLHLKGDKKNTLAISVILDSDEKESDCMRLECCDYCDLDSDSEMIHPIRPKDQSKQHGRLRSGLTSIIRKITRH